ncbi:FAD:protein FMN transferase [Desertibaculum subflavum]|uniref:FAD:protein FMN transferase n=1 Tax=Desertibaculum subflavum TaxID=2268458 RepID=UPI000E675AD0
MQRVLVPAAIDARALAVPGMAAVERLRGETMGTTWSVALRRPPGAALSELRRGIEGELDRVVAEMSHWRADSALGRFNRAPAGTWHPLPDGFYTVLDYALAMAERSGGAYDPTIGRLVDLWGFGPGAAAAPGVPPADADIAPALAAAGWHRIVLCRAQRRAFQPGGVRLDLSSVAKGYAVDRVSDWLSSAGVAASLVEIGGELRGQGVKPDGLPWWVAIEAPPEAAGHVPTVAALHGLAVATSGDYRRCFVHGGRRYAHTLDPRSGRPVENALASVTVLHPSCMQADALSTLLTVLGPEPGLAYATRNDIAALLVIRELDGGFSERLSPALAALLD